MITSRADLSSLETKERQVVAETRYEQWVHWPVNWTAVWVGALAALVAALIIGLIGIAVGAHLLGPENRVVDWHKFSIWGLVFCIVGGFISFAIGGWVTGKVGGILRSEPAILHGVIAWLVAVPILVALAGLGAGSFFGSWFGGLAGSPSWAARASAPYVRPDPLAADATAAERAAYREEVSAYQAKVRQWEEDTPRATRNSALGAVTAVLLGLVGSVVGGWMASGEPMTFTHYRTRKTGTPAAV